MKKRLFYLAFVLLFIGLSNFLSSCDDEKFSTNPSHILTFSHDTLRFDTVFTTIGSSTRKILVYNLNKEPLLISSVTLADAARSGFRINVDGHKGTSFADLEIREKDSMFIFVEVKVDPLNRKNPILIKDSLIFLTNGVRQEIKLMAYGQDVLILRGKTVLQDTVLTSYRPILIYDSLRVNEGVRLTCDPGTRLYFNNKASCLVRGTLQVNGSLDAPVVFRGDRLDNLFDDLPYNRIPGQWGGIRIYSESFDNLIDYADIHGGEYGIQCDSTDMGRLKLRLTNSIVHNVSKDALRFTMCMVEVGNSQISNAGKNCVNLLGGDYQFVHCTLADYFSWSMRSGVALSVKNVEGKIDYPLVNAAFRNCIIAGSSSDEIMGGQSKNKEIPFNYLFSYSLINSTKPDEGEVPECVWKKDDKFLYIGKTDYDYDFRPDSLSASINIGNMEDAQRYPIDLQGRLRLLDGQPDAGCYEWMPGDKRRKE